MTEQEREQGKMAASSRTRERFQFGALIVLCLTGSRGEAMITLTGRGGRDHSLYRVYIGIEPLRVYTETPLS